MGDVAKIVVVSENTARSAGLLGEHGLAVWLELPHARLLWDTGQGFALKHNAEQLDVPLDQVDAVLLSHGHYDHTGGLPDALPASRRTPVYVHPAALQPKFSCRPNAPCRDVGIPAEALAVLKDRAEMIETVKPTPVTDGVMLTGPVPRATWYEDTGGPFFLDAKADRPDPLEDDQALILETAEGVVVLVGCAHSGIVNILQYVRQLTNNRPIEAVLGGFHLVQASQERLQQTLKAFRELDIQMLAPGHCTGTAAIVAMRETLPDRCFEFSAGTRFEFEL